MRYQRRRKQIKKSNSNLTRVIFYNDLTDEQKEKVAKTFFYIEDRLPEGKYQSWLESHGFLFDKYNRLSVSMVYDANQK